MKWWLNILPPACADPSGIFITYQQKTIPLPDLPGGTTGDPASEKVMLIRNRLSRIYFLRRFFSYPLTLNWSTVSGLGPVRISKIFLSYFTARIFDRRQESTLEDFFIKRFGKELYHTFFKDYTEKVWGVSCRQIPAEWGHQRIKKLSFRKAILHAVSSLTGRNDKGILQEGTETSLIEKFLYPKFGPGQLWEEVARQVIDMGGEIHLNCRVNKIRLINNQVNHVTGIKSNQIPVDFYGDYFFSSMPVKELVAAIPDPVDHAVRVVADGLQYRDFITVGLLLKDCLLKTKSGELVKDNWIYIQEKEVRIGRLQLFNNWSPFLVKDASTTWLGLEYFCQKGDDLWSLTDQEFIRFAIEELHTIGIIERTAVIDSTIIRVEKAYPAYFGTYKDFDQVKAFADAIPNLFLVGRNGMHKYNNADHSMLTAMRAVDNIIEHIHTKENIWIINTEMDYHESATTK